MALIDQDLLNDFYKQFKDVTGVQLSKENINSLVKVIRKTVLPINECIINIDRIIEKLNTLDGSSSTDSTAILEIKEQLKEILARLDEDKNVKWEGENE